MSVEIKVPSVGESITTGTLASWLKDAGDTVTEGEMLFELETDKSLLEVPAPAGGILEILVAPETEVQVGQTVGRLQPAGATVAPAPVAEPTPEPARRAAPPLSPAVRKVIAEHDLDPGGIEGTGKDGRITKADALRAVEARETAAPPAASVTPPPASAAPAPPPPPAPPQAAGTRRVRRERLSRLRKRTAERLVEAKQNTAYLTTFNEIDMHAVMAIRARHKADFEKSHGIRIGFMSFFVKACCRALEAFPAVNAQLEGDEILYHDYCDIGVAVSIDQGLIVPVLRDAQRMRFAEIEAAIAGLAHQAKNKQLLPDALIGGTFSITNGGVFGSLMSTPIPAYPQTAILGMHAIKERPAVVDGQVVVRPIMVVALTYDHRVIDGRDAVGFLARVRDLVEQPDKLLLEL